jgi:predicted transcriptional regulator
MKKEDTIGIRVPAELKRALNQIARNEGRSLAQVCEIFLRGGTFSYKEEGSKYLQRVLARQKKETSE